MKAGNVHGRRPRWFRITTLAATVVVVIGMVTGCGGSSRPVSSETATTSTTIGPATTAAEPTPGSQTQWPVVASGEIAGTVWKVEVQSSGGMTCTLVQTENSGGVARANSCGATRVGATVRGTLQASMAEILDDHRRLLSSVAVAVASPDVQGVVFTVRGPEGSTSSLSSDGEVVPIATGGSIKVFVQQLDAPAGAEISAVVGSTG